MIKTNLKLLNQLLNSENFDKQLANRYLINQNVDLLNIKNTFKKKIEFNDIQKVCYQNKIKNLDIIKFALNEFKYDKKIFPIIQGSYADGTAYEGWSDLDMVLIINKKIYQEDLTEIFNRIKIIKNKIVNNLQPLQHHGIFIIDKNSLSLYPESFMPSSAFKGAISYKKGNFFINEYLEKNFFLNALNNRYYYINNALKTGFYNHHRFNNIPLDINNPRNCLYQVYAYINYLLLIPCITYSAIGNSMYKGDVLLESSKWPISKNSIYFFKLINKFRLDWIKNKFTPCKPNDLIPDFLLLYLNRDFWISAKNYEKEFIKFARTGFR